MNYPLTLSFKFLAFASQIHVRDASGKTVMFVKQKAFKLKEDITVYTDATQTAPMYTIKADRVLDFNAKYRLADAEGKALGSVGRRGMRSLWRSQYEVFDREDALIYTIREENPWIRVFDAFLEAIPFANILAGFVFHPSYVMTDTSGEVLMRLTKKSSLIESQFRIDALKEFSNEREQLAILSQLITVILERVKG